MTPIIDEDSVSPISSGVPAVAGSELEFYFRTFFSEHFNYRDFLRIQRFNTDPKLREQVRLHHKFYPRTEVHALQPDPSRLAAVNLQTVLRERRSHRRFQNKSVSFADLSTMIRFANGLKGDGDSKDITERIVPSAGRRFPLELYLVANKIEGLSPALYHFSIRDGVLEKLREIEPEKEMLTLFADPNLDWKNFAGLFFITGVFSRTLEKYSWRGWRMIFAEAGYLLSHLWLLSEILGLGGCALAGGFDRKVCRFLRVQSHQEGLLMSFLFGAPGDE